LITSDVFIAGGGPAGLVAGIAARRKGLDVVVADGARPEIDKSCGEGLMPDALAVLASLSVELNASAGQPLQGIRFLGRDSGVEARFREGVGLGMRRTVLHGALVRQAEAAGVRLLWNSPVTALDHEVLKVGGEMVCSRYIVGADGGNSSVRRWSGLDARVSEGLRYGFRRHYRGEQWTDHVEVHWSSGCQIYVTPIAPDVVCVASLAREADLRLDQALPRFPDLNRRLHSAQVVSTERGAVSASRRLRRVTKANVALIGDASGSVDAVTGEGMCLAFRQAVALADALAADRLEGYQAAHERIRRGPALMADMLLLLDRRDTLRGRVLAALESRPAVFADMLATHVGEWSALSMVWPLVSLGWGLLTV
jgi:flavin-dependent dehydrogenase